MNLLTLKHTNMKKILFAAVAALAITSCSQNEMDGIDNGQKGKADCPRVWYSRRRNL